SLQPNAEVRLHFDVHIHPLCAAGEQTKMLTNVVQARPQGGDVIRDEVSFVAACPGYDPLAIAVASNELPDVLGWDRVS
ncbi:MAG: hypothetical protein KDE58_03360, partial [Caldilineaceae bacterium]|nr:hypothetical protein [Caldilineaceae bacterium]